MLKNLHNQWKRLIHGFALLWEMLKLAWRAQPLCLLILLLLQVFEGLIPVASGYISKGLFDELSQVFRGIPFTQLLQGLIFLLLAQAAISVVGQLTSPLQDYLQAELNRQLTLSIRQALYKKMNSLSGLAHFEDPHFHNTLQVVASHVQFAPAQTLQTFARLLQGLITLISFFAVLFLLSPLLALGLGLAVIPHLIVQLKLNRQQFSLYMENSPQERRAAYYSQVLSWIPFAKEVRLFLLGDHFLQRFTQTTEHIYEAQRKFQLRELRWQGLLSMLTSCVSTGAFIIVVLQAFSGRISLGDMALYIQAVDNTQKTLMSMAFALSRLGENLLFFKQYQEVQALPDRISHTAHPRPVPQLTQGITFRNVSFRYSENHPWIVRHLNLSLPAGRCLALVGLNGAGKTTLVKLLTRLYDPSEGEILWDGIDIREFEPTEYRRHLGTIFQDFVRYELSAQENIGLGATELLEDLPSIEDAARKAGVHERLSALPHGYQSMLSRWMAEETDGEEDEGTDLSGGEWQKLALARMFLRNAEAIILDEPTASLDAQTEYELFQQFRKLMQNHTCLLITHRFSTVRMADFIAVLEQGSVSEYGSHEELVEHAGTYARLYNMQVESYIGKVPVQEQIG
ncbi:ABC transporter ATP-binding protein [Ktedonosporobacter rubrisoli]|uniref:ABC transporter ATP-binding protein n=1 Tax=Ktedonosporobacter rubrisoli TaxID=2509675 RepID=A0A4P6JKB3_KTERU|nr:ABC transporter ATP-binding protein [Ktedonosporobacter rubrisoli]QBD75493.1 ABC transporter ATP-binding protein [Ktedonosporobacter rubrisoli]